jgi:hypothetical protein
MNATLKSLKLKDVMIRRFMMRAFSFLCTNKALKCLVIDVQRGVDESYLFAFRTGIDITAILQENATFESLFIQNIYGWIESIEAEEYITLVTILQHNTTLKTLNFYQVFG